MSNITEIYNPHVLGANGSVVINGIKIGAFLAVTAGTLTITNSPGGTVLLNALPVAAGAYVPIHMNLKSYGGVGATVTLGGGASGTLLA